MSKKALRKKLYKESGGNCYLCNKPIKFFSQATIDHFIPKSKGGTNSLENLKIAHESCNKNKADKIINQPLPNVEWWY